MLQPKAFAGLCPRGSATNASIDLNSVMLTLMQAEHPEMRALTTMTAGTRNRQKALCSSRHSLYVFQVTFSTTHKDEILLHAVSGQLLS